MRGRIGEQLIFSSNVIQAIRRRLRNLPTGLQLSQTRPAIASAYGAVKVPGYLRVELVLSHLIPITTL